MSLPKIEWRFELPATLEAIEQFCLDFENWRMKACANLASFPIELLLREALTNSVIHGCSEAADKHVSCVLRVKPGRLVVSIQDPGEGFDWNAAWDQHPDISDTRGRGVEIFRRYANAVRFNLKGNSVTLIKRF